MNKDKIVEVARCVKRLAKKVKVAEDEIDIAIKVIEMVQFNLPRCTVEELEESKGMIMDGRVPELVVIDLKELSMLDFIIELKGSSRECHLVEKRHFVHFFLRQNTKYSLQRIGGVFGKNHATVMNSEKRVSDMISVRDKKAMALYREINDCLINAGYKWIVNQPNLNY